MHKEPMGTESTELQVAPRRVLGAQKRPQVRLEEPQRRDLPGWLFPTELARWGRAVDLRAVWGEEPGPRTRAAMQV